MTLLEKFREADKYSLTKPTHDRKCEEIADRYAIDFAAWLNEIQSFHSGEDAYYYMNKWHTYQEILEEFKKEKGL